jgi:RNA polymerase sigma-70 factor (ECF subfamily)
MDAGNGKEQGAGGKQSRPFDEATLREVCRRVPEAMNRFFDHYYDRIYGHVAHLLRDAHLAEDVTQEAFLRLSRAIDRLDPECDPTGWVFTVATNCVRDHWRSRAHKQSRRNIAMENGGVGDLANGKKRADERLERRHEQEAVQRALAELSDADRQVILLRNYEELETATIAQMLEATPEAIRQRHSRAVSRLGTAFAKFTERNGR